MGNNIADFVSIYIAAISSGFVGLVVYVFTSHSKSTSKRIDSRSKENEENTLEISNIKITLKGFEQKFISLEKGQAQLERGQEKNEVLINEKFDRLEGKIDKITDKLIPSNSFSKKSD